MSRRVVITGMGVVSPNANGLADFEKALRQGRSGIRNIPALEELGFACRIAGVPENFEPWCRKMVPEHEILGSSDSLDYVAAAALEAWDDSGLARPEPDDEPDWDTGAVVGTGIGDMHTIAERIVPMVNAKNVRRLGSRVVEQVMHSGPSARVAGLLALGNRVSSNSSACTTGTEAVVEAAGRIRDGQARRMVAGACEGACPHTWGGFDSMRVLARKYNDRPQAGSRPMSATADGFVPGAGAGILILEELETALARGARIHAEILGGFVNCGGQRKGGSMTAPNPAGVRRCIEGCLARAGVSPQEIDAVSGHLTATQADPLEIGNWAAALSATPASFPFINSTKSLIGHCLGAAGAIETVAAVLELCKGFLHPSENCEDPHPDIEPYAERLVRTAMEAPGLRTMAKASFGFGDVNACMILRKWS
ncbi:MAG: beta-ketoacyl-[acyl-carrier-protein] synthase family protein [Thermodesulfobacteriota bacterium]